MCLTDTDNLKQKTEAENVYEYFYKDKGLFEFSNYPKYSKYYNNASKLVECNMKYETCDVPVKGFVVLKSEMYIFMP